LRRTADNQLLTESVVKNQYLSQRGHDAYKCEAAAAGAAAAQHSEGRQQQASPTQPQRSLSAVPAANIVQDPGLNPSAPSNASAPEAEHEHVDSSHSPSDPKSSSPRSCSACEGAANSLFARFFQVFPIKRQSKIHRYR
jgi:hypothetical protein